MATKDTSKNTMLISVREERVYRVPRSMGEYVLELLGEGADRSRLEELAEDLEGPRGYGLARRSLNVTVDPDAKNRSKGGK